MEELKALDEVFAPDSRMEGWGTLESEHRELSEIRLSDSVPEDIRNYFETIKNICLYGRFVYAFYGVATSLTFLLLEFALKVRLAKGKDQRKGRFKELLRRAIKDGLINEEGFSHIRQLSERQAEMRELLQVEGTPIFTPTETDSYLKILESVLPNFRNRFAHPKHQPIVFPHEARFAIRFAAEFVNQLYAK